MVRGIATLGAGALFGVGLAIGGMTDPARVKGFLDFFGTWDPTLVFVLAGAVATTFVLVRLAGGRSAPVLAEGFSPPNAGKIDGKLVAGAAIFGAGWGLSGFCPGPAIAAIAGGFPSVYLFLAAMAATMIAYDRIKIPRKPATGSGDRMAAQTDG